MTDFQDPISVFAISSNASILDILKTTLDNEKNYPFFEFHESSGNLMSEIERLQPTCIFLDYLFQSTNSLDLIDRITLQFPEIIVVIILPHDKITEANRAILAGARAFMVHPFAQKDILDTLKQVKELYKRSRQGKIDENKASVAANGTYSVFSPKGGVGCSTVAINLSIAMVEELKQEVLLMDGKLFFGALDVLLNLKTQNSISDLIPHVGSLDEELLNDVISEHSTGIKVLPAPLSPITAQGIRPEELHHIITAVQGVYSKIVIDAGNYLNENTVTLMDASHKILLVIHPEIASLRDASRFIEICYSTLSIPKDKLLLVVNEYDHRDGISLGDIERSLQMKAFATLPWDARTPLQSINRGTPLYKQGRTPLRKSFETMAKNLAKFFSNDNADVQPAVAKKSFSDMLSKSSRLG